MTARNVELAIVMSAAVATIFMFANKRDLNELLQTGTIALMAGLPIGIYRLWLRKQDAPQ